MCAAGSCQLIWEQFYDKEINIECKLRMVVLISTVYSSEDCLGADLSDVAPGRACRKKRLILPALISKKDHKTV